MSKVIEISDERIEQLKKKWKQVQLSNEGVGSNRWFEASGIMQTLQILEIDIEGINKQSRLDQIKSNKKTVIDREGDKVTIKAEDFEWLMGKASETNE